MPYEEKDEDAEHLRIVKMHNTPTYSNRFCIQDNISAQAKAQMQVATAMAAALTK